MGGGASSGAETMALYGCGTAPAEFLELFSSRKAFRQCWRSWRRSWRWSGVHRQPRWPVGPHSTKGSGKDEAVNGELAAFWSAAALCDWLPDFQRVPSKSNVADAASKPPALKMCFVGEG